MESSISISTSSINQHAGRLTNISATATASITNDNSNTNNVASVLHQIIKSLKKLHQSRTNTLQNIMNKTKMKLI